MPYTLNEKWIKVEKKLEIDLSDLCNSRKNFKRICPLFRVQLRKKCSRKRKKETFNNTIYDMEQKGKLLEKGKTLTPHIVVCVEHFFIF